MVQFKSDGSWVGGNFTAAEEALLEKQKSNIEDMQSTDRLMQKLGISFEDVCEDCQGGEGITAVRQSNTYNNYN